MTTVTKIFVVLACLFAFVFTPTAIQFAARTHDWKTLAGGLADDAETAIAYERSAIATAASTIEHLKGRLDGERQAVEAAQQRIGDLQKENAGLALDLRKLEASRGTWENSASTLSAQLKVINTHNEELTKENARLAQSEQDLNRRNIELWNRVEELTADSVIFARQLKLRIEEIAHLRSENQDLRERLGVGKPGEGRMTATASPTAGPAGPTEGKHIRGEVTQTNDALGLVTISVGSASGVVEGMTMAVVRGDKYICDLVITGPVRTTDALGRLDQEDRGKVREKDMVVDASSFMAGRVK